MWTIILRTNPLTEDIEAELHRRAVTGLRQQRRHQLIRLLGKGQMNLLLNFRQTLGLSHQSRKPLLLLAANLRRHLIDDLGR